MQKQRIDNVDKNNTNVSSTVYTLLRQKALLETEYNEEKENFKRQMQAIGLERRIKRGDAWHPVRIGRSYYNSLNQLAIEVYRTSDEDIEHNFEFGKPVCFFKVEQDDRLDSATSKADKHKGFDVITTGMVSYADADRMVVTIPDKTGTATMLQNTDGIGIQLFFDETSYKLMFEALDRAIRAKGNRLAYLRDLFYSKQKAQTFSFDTIRFSWLNSTQELAVNNVLRAKDVAVVHGPPGTGKTTTLVEAIYETLKRESQVMVCAQSNMAVDWISEKLVDRGVPVLRIGNPTRVNDKMLSFTYERKFESHPDYPELWSIRKAIREMRSNRKRGVSDNWHQKLDRLKSRATEIECRINAQLFGEARVIASTLVGSANRVMSGQKFTTLFIDEAAQALEAACWIPMKRTTRVVFAGDHCQLPPTVKSIEAMRGGLAKTLMERIVENKPEVVTLLTMQYRMNEKIMQFSSDWFYDGKVIAAPEVCHRGILDYDLPMIWIDTSGTEAYEQFVGESFGRINKKEAALTLEKLQEYFEKTGKQRILDESIDVGIISPYRAQVQYLRQQIKKKEFFRPYRKLISVNTVDGFQGHERDITIISLVRSNNEGQIGFLSDLRRMNVAITRARMKLIIMGNAETLSHTLFYKKLYEYVMQISNGE